MYDWDDDKKAWFPRINEDFIAHYQMSYGMDVSGADVKPVDQSPGVDFSAIPAAPDVNDPGYSEWYTKYGNTTNSQEYRDWYNYYYGQQGQSDTDTEAATQPDKCLTAVQSNPHDESYWEQLKEQAVKDAEAGIEPTKAEDFEKAQETDKKGKKKKEKPPPKPASWFDMEEQDNTNVYFSGLPPSITADSFKELTTKCGLIAFDPITKKPKLKIYKDPDGNPKGDGLCCYIKQESVELALKILDGYVLDGHTLSVEKAKFELKGSYDPSKRKRKLTNKEKKAFREKQAKLFEWRPDKPRFARARHEKTVIVKNVFSLEEVDKNLLLVSELEEDLTSECAKYGQVKKVKVYERNPEGVVSVTFSEAEEADVCRDAVNGRWFACRQLTAETWDGKTKYFIEETEAEYKERLSKWEQYLEGKSSSCGEAAPAVQDDRPVRNVPSAAAGSSAAVPPPHDAAGAEAGETATEQGDSMAAD